MTSLLIVLCNCSPESAHDIAQKLVQEKYAACVNVIPKVNSYYMWDEILHSEAEATLLIKTTRERYSELETYLKKIHPYDVPEIVAIPVESAFEDYVTWVRHNVK